MEIVNTISKTCNCNEQEAQEYLEDEVCNLKELQDLDDLRYSDLEDACQNLGIEIDNVEFFFNQIAY